MAGIFVRCRGSDMSKNDRPKVLLFGTKWLGAEMVSRLVAADVSAAVVTTDPSDRTARAAFDHGVPWTAKADDAPLMAMDFPWRPDLILSAHSFRILPPWVLAYARLGCIGYHPSLLPTYKGRHAIQRALADGQRIVGGTAYWMTAEVDGGPIVVARGRQLQERVQTLPGEAASDLWRRALAPLGADLLMEATIDVLRRDCPPTPDRA